MTESITINGRSFPVVSGARPEPVVGPPVDAKTKKPNKYRNKPVYLVGVVVTMDKEYARSIAKLTGVKVIRFDSRREYDRWGELQKLQRAGKIDDLERQRAFELAPSVRFDGEKKAKPALRLIVDFFYYEKGFRVVEDVKSDATAKTAAWRIKLHLMKSVHGIDVRIVK